MSNSSPDPKREKEAGAERARAAGTVRMPYGVRLPKDQYQKPSFLFGFNRGRAHGHNGLPVDPTNRNSAPGQPEVAEALLERPDPYGATMIGGPH